MENIKKLIIKKHKYTDLVFYRINKKLNITFNNEQIKNYIFSLIQNTNEEDIIKKWKNFYIYNKIDNIRITVNSFTYTVITVDRFKTNY